MPNRKDHNFLAEIFLDGILSKEEIDDINKRIDAPSQYMSPNTHRQVYHDLDPLRMDSLEITGGDPAKEVARLIHIAADTDKGIQLLLEMRRLNKKFGRR